MRIRRQARQFIGSVNRGKIVIAGGEHVSVQRGIRRFSRRVTAVVIVAAVTAAIPVAATTSVAIAITVAVAATATAFATLFEMPVIGRLDIADVQEAVAADAEINEGGLNARLDVDDAALVDVADV